MTPSIRPSYIGGEWLLSRETFEVRNPYDGAILAEVAFADGGQVERAVESAVDAFQVTRRRPAWERSKLLDAIADGLAARRVEFVATIVAEAGKPVTFAAAEVDRAQVTFRLASQLAAADEGDGIRMDASPQGAGHFGLVRRFPIGAILGITPFNFPLNLVAHKVAPAMASGNTILIKPALKTPLTALLLAEVIHGAGCIPGEVNVVPFDHSLIPGLLSDARIKMLSFTGSASVGWKLKSEAARMKVALELGGNAAVVIEPDADWQAAIPTIASGAFGFAGQSCISVQRVLVRRSIYDAFSGAFVSHVASALHVGDPSDPAVLVGPMITATAREKIVGWVRRAEAAGARVLLPLQIGEGSLLGPVILENVPRSEPVYAEEAFAPVVILEPYDSFEEALEIVNSSAFGLQAGVFTRDIGKSLRAFHELEVGGVMINQVPTFRVENMPYGGVKESGIGREGVRYAMGEMTEPRSLVVRT